MALDSVFVWVWLPGASEPCVVGRLDDRGASVTFTYGQSYLARADSIPLYEPDLPLRRGIIRPRSGDVPGPIADAGPDAWGRRVIEHRRAGDAADLGELDYLYSAGSNRIGALDFQRSSVTYEERGGDAAHLTELVEAADRVETGVPLTPALDQALLHGSSVGGARPKALIADGDRQLIAKFSSTTDTFPVVKAEFAAMALAARAGLSVAPVKLTSALGKDVLLVERFDRPAEGGRRLMVSALTILNLHDAAGMAGRYATYVDLADTIRARFTNPDATLREVFARITFSILVGNTDDHARNHAAFWNGRDLTITPAYDVCPQTRSGGEAAQAMAYGSHGERRSQLIHCVKHAAIYHLSTAEARTIIDGQIDTITNEWKDVADEARLTLAETQRLWNRQFLNPYALYDY